MTTDRKRHDEGITPSPMPEYHASPPPRYEATRCVLCGIYTRRPSWILIRHGQRIRVCPKCYAWDDGDL